MSIKKQETGSLIRTLVQISSQVHRNRQGSKAIIGPCFCTMIHNALEPSEQRIESYKKYIEHLNQQKHQT